MASARGVREALPVRRWRAAGGCVATLLMSGVALGLTTAPAGAATKVVVAEGSVRVVSDSEMALPVLPAPVNGRLAGYGFTAEVTGDACGPRVGEPGDEITAAGGDEVCVFSLSLAGAQPDTAAGTTPVGYPASGSVEVGGSALLISTAELDEANNPVDYAVAVPPGAPVVLTLTAAGFAQSFSLTAGRPVGVAPVALYRSRSAYELAVEPEVTERVAETDTQSGASASMDVTLTEVELDYFYPGDPTRRAPRPDEAYLGISFATAAEPGPTGTSFEGFTATPTGDVRLRLSDGTTFAAQAVVQPSADLLAGTWVFLVPAGVGAAEVVVAPGAKDGEEAAGVGPGVAVPVRFGEASWQIELPGASNAGFAGAAGGTPSNKPPSTPTTVVRQLGARRPGGLSPTAKAAAGGGGLLVVVGVIVVPLRRRRARYGREAVVRFPPPSLPPSADEDQAKMAELVDEDSDPGGAAPPADQSPTGPDRAVRPGRAGLFSVRILGALEVEGFARPPARAGVVELAVYVALAAPRAVSSDELRTVLGGRDDLAPATLHSNLSRLRSALPPGWLVAEGRTAWRFEGGLECDWAEFQALVAAGEPDRRIERLQAALALVRGVPFSGVPQGHYGWAADRYGQVDTAIVEAAHELVLLHLAAGRPAEAEQAAAGGLRGQPYSLLLHEDCLRASATSPARFDKAWRNCKARLPGDVHLARVREELLAERTR